MARIRSIKPEFFTSPQLVECSTSARLLFVGLWVHCDDGGVHPADPRRLKMEVFPGDDITAEQVAGMVDELIRARGDDGVGLIECFNCDGKTYWYVTGWGKHQKIDRPTFRYPKPPRLVDEPSTSPRRALDEPSPPESSRVESSREKKNRAEKRTHTPSAITRESEPAEAPADPVARVIPDRATIEQIRTAYCTGIGRPSLALPDLDAERIAARCRDPERVRQVAEVYAASLGARIKPSARSFAERWHEWEAEVDRPDPDDALWDRIARGETA